MNKVNEITPPPAEHAVMESTVNAAAMAPAVAKRAPRPRTVFARREAVVEGKTMRFELRADGLHVRRKHSRKRRVLSFADLVDAATGQGLLKY